ncbi:MAG: PilZ domain-containing protein [Magnetococcales bacterium]|nr:PilZ domain-containing protein [Magnetococcales bacterium]
MTNSDNPSNRTSTTVLHNPKKILDLIISGQKADSEIRVELANHLLDYFSHFKMSANKEHHLYVCISSLDPPIGNIHIRSASHVVLHFISNDSVATLHSRFIKILNNEILCLKFPKRVSLSPQKRNWIRIPNGPYLALQVEMVRPSGIMEDIHVQDISCGGLSFIFEQEAASLALNGVVDFRLVTTHYSCELWSQAKIVRISKAGDSDLYHARFQPQTAKEGQDIEAFVTTLQRAHLKRRQRLFRNSDDWPDVSGIHFEKLDEIDPKTMPMSAGMLLPALPAWSTLRNILALLGVSWLAMRLPSLGWGFLLLALSCLAHGIVSRQEDSQSGMAWSLLGLGISSFGLWHWLIA